MGAQADAAAERLAALVARGVVTVALELQHALTEATPVDTGWCRANWVPNVDLPAQGPFGSREAVDYTAQIAGTEAVASWQAGQGNIVISNHVPYVEALNASAKHAGFVDDAVERGMAAGLAKLGYVAASFEVGVQVTTVSG